MPPRLLSALPCLCHRAAHVCRVSWSGFAAALVVAASTSSAEVPMITAHRGASHDAPENTLAAFRLAWQQDADAIEGDFRLSADGEIVCIHDADTKRTCGVQLVVAKTPFDRLRDLDYGRWKAVSYAGEPCPTLAEVLESVPAGKQFFVELKTGPEIVAPLTRLLDQGTIDLDSLVIIAFDEETVAACKRELPSVKAHWLTSFRETEKGSGEWLPTAGMIAETVASCGADGVGMQGRRDTIDAAFVKTLTDRGVGEFHVWTIDEPADARYFADLGAIGITTNKPGFLRSSLEAK
jgi:glycerophosphoryl diester phosphodiesterase